MPVQAKQKTNDAHDIQLSVRTMPGIFTSAHTNGTIQSHFIVFFLYSVSAHFMQSQGRIPVGHPTPATAHISAICIGALSPPCRTWDAGAVWISMPPDNSGDLISANAMKSGDHPVG